MFFNLVTDFSASLNIVAENQLFTNKVDVFGLARTILVKATLMIIDHPSIISKFSHSLLGQRHSQYYIRLSQRFFGSENFDFYAQILEEQDIRIYEQIRDRLKRKYATKLLPPLYEVQATKHGLVFALRQKPTKSDLEAIKELILHTFSIPLGIYVFEKK